jgi:2-keto-3-deoxy-L-rhamnonate aldolase RhmA
MLKNLLKEKLAQNKPVFGTAMVTNSFDTALILAQVGCDFVMIDAEHGSMDIESAGLLVNAIQTTATTPLLRIPGNELAMVKRGLDTGAHGIVIPMINTKEEAEQAVQYCKYPPLGVRGIGAGRAALFGLAGDYYYFANQEIQVIVQIEHYKAVENVYDILSVPGIDIAFVGPGDLGSSLGVSGVGNPDLVDSFKKVVDACNKNNVVPGIFTQAGDIKEHLDLGFRFLLGGLDSMSIYGGVSPLLREFKSLTKPK